LPADGEALPLRGLEMLDADVRLEKRAVVLRHVAGREDIWR